MKSERTRAVVLRRTNYGEADRIVQVITPLGRRSVMARGVRREKSKLAGGIELFAVSDVVIGEGKGDLGVLTSARLVQFYRHILEEYDRMQFAYEAIKLVARATETIDEPEWYDVIVEVLAGLDATTIPLPLIQAWLYLRYSSLLGHEFALRYDIDGAPLSAEATYRYDAHEQGLRLDDRGDISADHIKLLRLIASKPIATLAQIGGIDESLPSVVAAVRAHAAV